MKPYPYREEEVSYSNPAAKIELAATLTIFLLSLIGIPATGGFFAKFYVFSAALKADVGAHGSHAGGGLLQIT